MQYLSKKAVLSQYPTTVFMCISGLVLLTLFAVLLVITGGTEVYPQTEALLFCVAGIVLCGVALGYVYCWISLFRYQLGDKEVTIEKGVIAKSYDAIPYARIQNINIRRSFWERVLGLSTVIVQTAGATSSPEGIIPGVDNGKAEQILETVQQQDGKPQSE